MKKTGLATLTALSLVMTHVPNITFAQEGFWSEAGLTEFVNSDRVSKEDRSYLEKVEKKLFASKTEQSAYRIANAAKKEKSHLATYIDLILSARLADMKKTTPKTVGILGASGKARTTGVSRPSQGMGLGAIAFGGGLLAALGMAGGGGGEGDGGSGGGGGGGDDGGGGGDDGDNGDDGSGGGDDGSGSQNDYDNSGDGDGQQDNYAGQQYDQEYEGTQDTFLEFLANYGLRTINVAPLHARNLKGAGTLAGIMDTGIDAYHKDLAGNVRRDLSWNFINNNRTLSDIHGHGTHVAGIIGARENGFGTVGVAPEVDLVSYNIIVPKGYDGETRYFTNRVFARAYEMAIDSGVHVLNNSWGWGISNEIDKFKDVDAVMRKGILNTTFLDQLKRLPQNDVVNVFAAGNSAQTNIDVMAGLPILVPELESHWIAVVSVDSSERISYFSNRCGIAKDFCLAAPGQDIYSANSGQSFKSGGDIIAMSGTSMATPHVTGAFAVLKSAFPELTGAEIRNIILETARDLGEPGVDLIYGRGHLDLENAMTPQGNLSIALSSDINGKTVDIQESTIDLGAGIGSALASSLGDEVIMVMDKYNRGFGAEISAFVADKPDVSSAAVMGNLAKFAMPSAMPKTIEIGNGTSVSMVGGKMTTFNVDNGNAAYSMSFDGKASENFVGADGTAWVNSGAFASAHLGMMDTKFGGKNSISLSENMKLSIGSYKGKVGGAGDATANAVGLAYDLDNVSFNMSYGNMTEEGSTFGGVTTGAFSLGDTKTVTEFMQFGAKMAIGENSAIHYSASMGNTDFSQTGIITGGSNIKTEAVSVGWSQKNVFGQNDSFSLAVSQPLSVQSGQIMMDVPVNRVASVNGVQSVEVERQTMVQSLQAYQAPMNIEIGYSKAVDEKQNSKISLGAVYRADEKLVGASLGFTMKF